MWILSLTAVVALSASVRAELLCRDGSCFNDTDKQSASNLLNLEGTAAVDKVCYTGLGCFSKKNGLLSFLSTLPDSPEMINVTFKIYSKEMINGTQIKYNDAATFTNLNFLHRQPEWLTILVHGFGSGPSAGWLPRLRDRVFDDIGGYVIIVDWSKGAEFPHYYKAAANMELVGRMLAHLTHRLLMSYSSGLSASRLHFVGHSLGAQMGHFFSGTLHNVSGLKPARITALDAAGPEFQENGVFVNRNDADFVEGLHTSGGGSVVAGEFGMLEPFGHVDFYANGGKQQPGCTAFSFGCSHVRAHQLYVEARSASKCRFISHSCSGGLAQYEQNKCVPEYDNWSVLGLDALSAPGRGIQFFETHAQSPYCESHKQNPLPFAVGF